VQQKFTQNHAKHKMTYMKVHQTKLIRIFSDEPKEMPRKNEIHFMETLFHVTWFLGSYFLFFLCVSFSLKMGGGVQVPLSHFLLFIVGTCLLVVIINCVLMSKVFFINLGG